MTDASCSEDSRDLIRIHRKQGLMLLLLLLLIPNLGCSEHSEELLLELCVVYFGSKKFTLVFICMFAYVLLAV